MTDTEKITQLQTLLNDAEATTALLSVYLADAKYAILNRMYPFGIPEDVLAVPERYDYLHIKLTQRYFLRRGAEGEISHDEPGANRSYKSVNDEDILMVIVPIAKVVGA